MNMELAQLVSITCHGNAYLAAKASAQPPEILREVPVFEEITQLKFFERQGIEDKLISNGTAGWYRYLKEHKCKRIRIVPISWKDERPDLPDRCAVAFAGSGSWAIISEGTKANLVWRQLYMESGRGEALTFIGTPIEGPLPAYSSDLEAAEANLRKALRDILEFTQKEGLGKNWEAIFTNALFILDSEGESHVSISALLPEGAYSHRARRLMAAASESWVFGGMGSWNDTGGGEGYSKVSDGLYAAMIDAIITATNEPPKAGR
jgi:hypothetical protein